MDKKILQREKAAYFLSKKIVFSQKLKKRDREKLKKGRLEARRSVSEVFMELR